MDEIWCNQTYNDYVVLEKGNYYLLYDGKEGDSGEGVVSTTIEQQVMERTAGKTGFTTTSAIPLTNGKASVGLISASCKEQYFVFTLKSESKVSFDLSVVDNPSVFCTGAKYSLISSTGKSYSGQLSKFKDSVFGLEDMVVGKGYVYAPTNYPQSGTVTAGKLPKGTYYLKLLKSYDDVDCVGSIKVTPHISNAVTIKTPKLKIKRGSKKITGTAVKKSTVKIKIGKKTYSTKTNKKGRFSLKLKNKLKKGQKVTVYVIKGKVKSKTVTYKVK